MHPVFKLAQPCFFTPQHAVSTWLGQFPGSVRGPYFLCLNALGGSVLVLYGLPIAAVCAAVRAVVTAVCIPVLVAYKLSSCGVELSHCD